MNIFFLHYDPVAAATLHVDKHVVKMVLETAQLLSTAHHVLDGPEIISSLPNLYQPTHVNHPCAVWVRSGDLPYQWTAALLRELCREYTHRYGKIHKVQASGLLDTLLAHVPRNIPQDTWTDPPQAMPVEYQRESTVDAYRAYYVNAKAHLHAWRNRPVPVWAVPAAQ